jgi:uncharacterized membrane protein
MERAVTPRERALIESVPTKIWEVVSPMAVEPRPDDPQWITILVWDFMPRRISNG